MRERLRSARVLLRALADLVVPPGCARCGASLAEPGLCDRCEGALPSADPVRPPPGLAAVVAGVAYAGEVERWIQRFKYPPGGPTRLAGLDPESRARVLALARCAARRAPGPAPGLVVAVPLHPRRLRERAFNPAAELAREVARCVSAPCDPVALMRTRDTPSQTGLGRAARRRNVAGAFSLRPAARLADRVWLVDDVVTTGATLAAAARALRRAGVRRVVGVCAAHTPSTT